MNCSNNLKQIGLGLHNYHSAYKQLPTQMSGTFTPGWEHDQDRDSVMQQNSWLVGILPYVEQQALWEIVSNPYRFDLAGNPLPAGQYFPAMGVAGDSDAGTSGNVTNPGARGYIGWMTEVPTFRCPSDPGVGLPAQGRTNYGASLGDAVHSQHLGPWTWDYRNYDSGRSQAMRAAQRGFFVAKTQSKFRDVLDGLANTIAAGEIATDLGDRDIRTNGGRNAAVAAAAADIDACDVDIDPATPTFWLDSATVAAEGDWPLRYGRGFAWAHGYTYMSGIQTIRPPNKAVCLDSAGGQWLPIRHDGVNPPSSRHQGGAHILMGDGAVVFITDSIEAGDQNSVPVRIGNVYPDPAAGAPKPVRLVGSPRYASQPRVDRRTTQPVGNVVLRLRFRNVSFAC